MLVQYLIALSSGLAGGFCGETRLKWLRSVEVFICKDFPMYAQCLYNACSFLYFCKLLLILPSAEAKNSFINKIFIYIICSMLPPWDNENMEDGEAQEINDRSSSS